VIVAQVLAVQFHGSSPCNSFRVLFDSRDAKVRAQKPSADKPDCSVMRCRFERAGAVSRGAERLGLCGGPADKNGLTRPALTGWLPS
jgi:hypothetical protein